jgi:hypothetical protein
MKFRFAQCTQLATLKAVRFATMNLYRMDVHVLEIISHVSTSTERIGSECPRGDAPSTLLLFIDNIGAHFCLRRGNWL